MPTHQFNSSGQIGKLNVIASNVEESQHAEDQQSVLEEANSGLLLSNSQIISAKFINRQSSYVPIVKEMWIQQKSTLASKQSSVRSSIRSASREAAAVAVKAQQQSAIALLSSIQVNADSSAQTKVNLVDKSGEGGFDNTAARPEEITVG